MGARGTDVAREAAALVLLNDDFASIVTAVRYGRRVFANLRKAIVFVVAVHVPIVGLSIVPVLLGWPMLLMPVHILFLQLIIDPACSVVFEAEPLEADAMTAPPPRSRRAPVRCGRHRARPVAGRRSAGAVAGGLCGRAKRHEIGRHGARADVHGAGAVQPGADPREPLLVIGVLARSWRIQQLVRLDHPGDPGLAGLRAGHSRRQPPVCVCHAHAASCCWLGPVSH